MMETETQELVVQQQALAAPSPLSILQTAVERGADIDTIERLAALQERMMMRQAEAEFNDAMSRVQTGLAHVAPNLTNPQTKSKYASYDALDRVVRPVYSKEGFSLSFDTDDCPLPEHVRVVCYVSKGSHTRKYKVDMPADGKGAKGGDVMTKTHATGAAMSYGMRYLLKYIFNIAIGEDDADGNMPGSLDSVQERCEWMANAKDLAELKRLYDDAKAAAVAARDTNALRAFAAAKDARKKELV